MAEVNEANTVLGDAEKRKIYDYDTCPLERFDSLRVKRILRLPCSAEINMIVSCGIRTTGGVWGERFRQPFETVYKRNI